VGDPGVRMSLAVIVSVSAPSRKTLVVGTDQGLDPDVDPGILDPAAWTVSRVSGLGQRPVVVAVALTGAYEATLTVHPQVTPGATYRVAGPEVTTPPSGGLIGPDPDLVTVPVGLVETWTDTPVPTGRLPVRNLLSVLGREFQRQSGRGASRLLLAWTPGDTRLVLTSTLPFGEDGAVFVGPMRFTYTSRTSGSLEGVTPQHETIEPLGVGTLVVADDTAGAADDGPLAPEPPPDNPPPDWFRGITYLDL